MAIVGQDVRIQAAITTGAMAVTMAQCTDVFKAHLQAHSGMLPNIARNRIVNRPSSPGACLGTTRRAILSPPSQPVSAPPWFTPSFVRLGSWNICIFITYEELKRLLHYMNSAGPSPSCLIVGQDKIHLSRYSVLVVLSAAIIL
ncbi:hypothetical protein HPB50_008536 [Hyalomma asiaticum]|uniref:Uncharacterized protein n=1 Tax=Hyalomma asiaticum TaxID=266040 RepID=A0ACB7RMK8_HYAAI|nr:hypothetical protein HPB50_008536 [Hyalomma asiaticum]